MDYQHDDEVGERRGAMPAFEEEVIAMIKNKYYREASECVKRTMEVYPECLQSQQRGFRLLIISETLRYGSIILPNCDGAFDYYSVLHLPPSSSYRQVKDRFFQLRDELCLLKNNKWSGGLHDLLTLAQSLLYSARCNLCEKSIRSDFFNKRKESVLLDSIFLDWPSNTKPTSSLVESYMDWKPPLYRVAAIHHMKSAAAAAAAADDKEEEEVVVEEKVVGVEVEVGKEEESDNDDESDGEESDEEEEEESDDVEESDEEEEDASLSPELRILKKKVFDEMPQNPHYTPLEKYSGRVRDGMILGLEVAFTELCEEIKNLEDIQSFWYELDGFNEEISQLKEMGYNVEKVSKRIAILKTIAEHKRAFSGAAKKLENEVRDREANVIDLQKRISELQTEIEESKSKIQTFKKNSNDAGAKFAAIVKAKWV